MYRKMVYQSSHFDIKTKILTKIFYERNYYNEKAITVPLLIHWMKPKLYQRLKVLKFLILIYVFCSC